MTTCVIKINGVVLVDKPKLDKSFFKELDILENEFNKTGSITLKSSAAVGLAAATNFVVGSNLGLYDKLAPLIDIIQELALPVGIGMATWGAIEYMVGHKDKGQKLIISSVLGYAGTFLIPFLFQIIKTTLGGL